MRPPGVLLIVAALLVAGCQDDRLTSQGEPSPLTTSSDLSTANAQQLPPMDDGSQLQDEQLEQAIQRAARSSEVAEVLSVSQVTAVLVQAGDGRSFGAERVAWVVFAFGQAHRPAVYPWNGMCDIGGQTAEWLGVVVRTHLDGDGVESSPLWTTGVNCVSWFPTGELPFDFEPG